MLQVTKISSNLNTTLPSLNCIAAAEEDCHGAGGEKQPVTDFYKPASASAAPDDEEGDNEDEDRSAGFLSPGSHQASAPPLHFSDIRSPSLSVFSCTEPQVTPTMRYFLRKNYGDRLCFARKTLTNFATQLRSTSKAIIG